MGRDQVPQGIGECRQIVRGLRGLSSTLSAPPALSRRVLVETGLADTYFLLQTPVGGVYVAYNRLGVSRVSHAGDAAAFEKMFRAEFDRPVYPAEQPPADLQRALIRQLTGERRSRRVTFDLRTLSEFERAVLMKALEIPHGEVRPYSWVAREIGRPKAVRAVGSVLRRNPVPLFIPCHRVVRSDGHLGRYSMVGVTKSEVLESEGLAADALEDLAREGVRYIGSDTTHVFCYPSCGHGQLITDRHRVLFHSESEARAAGYRPCRSCRPVLEA